MKPSVYGAHLDAYRETVRGFFAGISDDDLRAFDDRGSPSSFWRKAAGAGVMAGMIPPEYGGRGAARLSAVILSEELGRWPGGATIGGGMSTDLATTFLIDNGTEAQRRTWFPKLLSGEITQAICLTEPEAGSDAAAITCAAVRDGDDYVLNGVKSPVMNGCAAGLLYVIAKTDPAAKARGMSMIIVPRETPGLSFTRMETLGYRGGDTAEIVFKDVRVPVTNLVGQEGGALALFQETLKIDRLQIAARSLGAAAGAVALTIEHCRHRRMFGQRLVDMQNTQFVLAGLETEVAVGHAFLEKLVGKYLDGTFTDDDGAMAKIWLPELEGRVLDACMQLWGSHGWMDKAPIGRMFTAARAQRIQAGATELMKSLLGRRYLKP